MSKPRYLKILAVVEEDFKPISGKITVEKGNWHCENVITIKLGDDFQPKHVEEMDALIPLFIASVLRAAEGESNE